MRNTRAYLKVIRSVFAWCFVAFSGIIIAFGGKTIDYYCINGSPPFLGQNVSGLPYCSILVAFIYILSFAVGATLFILLASVLIDITKLFGSKTLRGIKYYFARIRPAKILVTKVVLENEAYVIVYNDEFWLRADKVSARTEYVYRDLNDPVKDYIKWDKQPIHNVETSIHRKAYRLLHFATINAKESSFTIHRAKGDETFPFPEEENLYHFPVFLNGIMLFLRTKVSKVTLGKSFEVLVSWSEKDGIDVKIKNQQGR